MRGCQRQVGDLVEGPSASSWTYVANRSLKPLQGGRHTGCVAAIQDDAWEGKHQEESEQNQNRNPESLVGFGLALGAQFSSKRVLLGVIHLCSMEVADSALTTLGAHHLEGTPVAN